MKTNRYLTFLGIIPFLFLLMLSFYYSERTDYISNLFHTYSAVIISFIAGTHWGICLQSKDRNNSVLLESNLITLIAWFSLFYLGLITELIMIGCLEIEIIFFLRQNMLLIMAIDIGMKLRK